MLGISNLTLNNVRSHSSGVFQFVPDMNAIVGPNGSGKTTIIEALYTLLQGSSFKGTIAEIAQYGSNKFRAELHYKTENSEHLRSLGFMQADGVIQKKWQVDNKKHARFPLAARLPLVLFEPDIARLVSGSPQRRRSYVDQIANQLDIEVASAQNKFDRVLKQRNQLLKKLQSEYATTGPPELFVWNTQLARLSEVIVSARSNVIVKLQNNISAHYQQLGGSDDVLLTYVSTVTKDAVDYANRLLQILETNVQRDIALGYTNFGPHRDDIEIVLANQLAADRASRGEIRTIVIALKLLETELLSEHFKDRGMKPILLLDDVLSELDLVHQERVLDGLRDHQVFLTTTDAHALTPGVHTIFLE